MLRDPMRSFTASEHVIPFLAGRVRTLQWTCLALSVMSLACVAHGNTGQDDTIKVTSKDNPVSVLTKEVGLSDGELALLIDFRKSPPVKHLVTRTNRGFIIDALKNPVSSSPITGDTLSFAPGRMVHVVVLTGPNDSPTLAPTYQYANGTSLSIGPADKAAIKDPLSFSAGDVRIITAQSGSTTAWIAYDYSRIDLLTPESGALTVKAFSPAAVTVPDDGNVDTVALTITKSPVWDFQSSFSPSFIVQREGNPTFGLTTTAISFGRNSNLSLDAVSIFPAGGSTETSLGQALSYSTIIGSSYVNGGSHFFGFAVGVKLSLGVSEFSFDTHTWGSKPFVALTFSIPLKIKA